MASGVQEEYVHKNRLQQISLRLFARFPIFETHSEGSQHDPKFRSKVVVDGTQLISPLTFNRRKDAEQYVSKIALEHLYTKLKKDGHLQINNATMFCKSILHEFAVKKKIPLPVYTTSNVEGVLPMFKTSIIFDGNTFHGSLSRNKKDAEQFGARYVIQWILDQPDDRSTTIAEIIKTKHKFFKEIHEDRNLPLVTEYNPPPLQTIVNNHPSGAANKEKDIPIASSNTQGTHAPYKVATIDHPSGAANKEKDIPIASSNTQGPAVADPIPPALEESKEEHSSLVAIKLPAAVSDPHNAEINLNMPAAVDSASKSVNQISVNSDVEQTVKVEVEESFEASPSKVNNPTGKRSRKNKKGSAKKLRMDERTPAGMSV